MPRKWSRIALELVDVRIERLHQITPEDAVAEGADNAWDHEIAQAGLAQSLNELRDENGSHLRGFRYANVGGFAISWNEINGKRPGCAWSANPWVWVLNFRRMEAAS